MAALVPSCGHLLLRSKIISNFIFFAFSLILLASNSSPRTAVKTPNCSTEHFLSIFNISTLHPIDQRGFLLLTKDPLQNTTHKITKWTINNTEIRASHGWNRNNFSRHISYKLLCETIVQQSKGMSKYHVMFSLIDERGKNTANNYVCLGVTSRGPLVFQIYFSKVKAYSSKPSYNQVCVPSTMVDEGFTFVNFDDSENWNNFTQHFAKIVPCPHAGGYAIKSWNSNFISNKCSVPYKLDVLGDSKQEFTSESHKTWHYRFEVECGMGTGMVFSGHSPYCQTPPASTFLGTYNLKCFSRWSDGIYIYAIALGDYPVTSYCIRVPITKTDNFKLFALNHGTCTFPVLYEYHFKMELLQYSQMPINVRHSPPYMILNESWPQNIQGNWYKETTTLGIDHILITKYTFNSTQLGVWQFLSPATCITETYGLQSMGKLYFVTSDNLNGCLIRLAIIWLGEFSKSVVGFQLSKSVIMDRDKLLPDLCPVIKFGETSNLLKDTYHVSPFSWNNLVNTDEGLPYVSCDLGTLTKMTITLEGGQSCTASIEKHNRTTFSVMLHACDKPVKGIDVNARVQYNCMARYKGKDGVYTILVTQTPVKQSNVAKRQFICWVFPKGQSRGLIMPVGDCSDETFLEVYDKRFKPALVEFCQIFMGVAKGSKSTLSMFLLVVSIAVLSVTLK